MLVANCHTLKTEILSVWAQFAFVTSHFCPSDAGCRPGSSRWDSGSDDPSFIALSLTSSLLSELYPAWDSSSQLTSCHHFFLSSVLPPASPPYTKPQCYHWAFSVVSTPTLVFQGAGCMAAETMNFSGLVHPKKWMLSCSAYLVEH